MGAAMVYWAPICYKWILEKAGNQKNQWYIFFWAASFVATVCNAAILVFEIMHLSDVGPVYQFHIAKIVLEPSFCLLDLVLAICIIEGLSTQQQSTESPKSTQQAPLASPNSTQQTPEPPNSTQQAPEPPNSTQQAPESPNSTQQALESPNSTPQQAPLESPNSTQQTHEPPNSMQEAQEPPNSTQQAPESPNPMQQAPESPNPMQQAPESPNSTKEALHVPKFAVILSRVICCMFLCNKRSQETLVRLLALWSLMLFIHLLSLAVLPTMIWAFVLPLRIISLITSIWAILFCLTAAVAVFIYSISSISISSQPQQNGINKCCSICRVFCLVAIPPLFLAILVLGTIIYLRLIMTSIDTTSVAGIIASFLPTAALTIIGWLVSGRVLIGVSGEGEGASQGTPHQSNRGGRVYNFIKHSLQAFRGTTTYHHLPQSVDSNPI